MPKYPPGIQTVYDFHVGVAKTTGKVFGVFLIAMGVVVGFVLMGQLRSARGTEVAIYLLAPILPMILGLLAMRKIPMSTKLKMSSLFDLLLNQPDQVGRVCEAYTTATLGLDKHKLSTAAVPWDGKLEFGTPPNKGNLKIWIFKTGDQDPREFVIGPDHRAALCRDMLEALKKGSGETLWGADTMRVKDVV